jgi:urease accessory protein
LLCEGSGWNDAVLFGRCWHDDVMELNDLALALAGSAERHQETVQLGRNFAIAASVWTGAANTEGVIAYPIAAGRACRDMGINPGQALIAFLQGYCAALVSVAVRLVPLGQTSGLTILRDLAPLISATALRASRSTLADLGGSCVAAEIAAMKHERLEPRIFRT